MYTKHATVAVVLSLMVVVSSVWVNAVSVTMVDGTDVVQVDKVLYLSPDHNLHVHYQPVHAKATTISTTTTQQQHNTNNNNTNNSRKLVDRYHSDMML
jgi:hypothetical protein